MPIDYDTTQAEEPVVREGNGWRQHTPCRQHRLRCYEDCAPADANNPAIDDHFTSMTSALRTGFPTSFETAAVYNVIDESLANWDHLCSLHPTEATTAEFGEDRPSRRQQMAAYRDVSLNRAAARGTAGHAYLEDRLLGREPNWDWVARDGALPWIAAVENYLDTEQPEVEFVETVAFDRSYMVAGSVDAVLRTVRLGLAEQDWKFRTQKAKRHFTHDRRPKEGAQLGGYHRMLTGGYYMDDRGRRQQITEPLSIAVVTFGADGTYAIHEVDPDAAEQAYETTMAMREHSKLSFLMPAKPDYSGDFDPNPRLSEVIANVPDDAPEKMVLNAEWIKAGFGRPSKGEVEPGRFGEAMALIYAHTAKYQPFATDTTAPPETMVDVTVAEDLARRLRELPADLADEARRNATGLPALSSIALTQSDAEDWDRVLALAETAHRSRQQEAVGVFNMARQVDGALALLPDDIGTWTDRDLTLATAIVSALTTNEVTPDGATAVTQGHLLDMYGSKAAVKKIAREKAGDLGIDAPSRWEDLVADPILCAVLVAT